MNTKYLYLFPCIKKSSSSISIILVLLFKNKNYKTTYWCLLPNELKKNVPKCIVTFDILPPDSLYNRQEPCNLVFILIFSENVYSHVTIFLKFLIWVLESILPDSGWDGEVRLYMSLFWTSMKFWLVYAKTTQTNLNANIFAHQ